MCGIVGVFNVPESQISEVREQVLVMSKRIRHRGPDWSGIYTGKRVVMAHERLAIVDPESGGQPLYSADGTVVLTVNGEIYNHRELRQKLAGKYRFSTGSDCEVILALYQEKGMDFLEDLSGIFAFALYDSRSDRFLIARDPIGVIPLYIGYGDEGQVYVASELKASRGSARVMSPSCPVIVTTVPRGVCAAGTDAVGPTMRPSAGVRSRSRPCGRRCVRPWSGSS